MKSELELPKGIYNPKSICYFIVVIQSINSLSQLTNYIFKNTFNKNTFTYSLQQLLLELNKPGKTLLNCNYLSILKLLNNESIDPLRKNCADELLICILMKLKEELLDKSLFSSLFKCTNEGELDFIIFISYNNFCLAFNDPNVKNSVIHKDTFVFNDYNLLNDRIVFNPTYLIIILSNTGPPLHKFKMEKISVNNQKYILKVKCLFGKKYLMFDHYTAIIKLGKMYNFDDEKVKEFKESIWNRNKKITYLIYEKEEIK